jgi:hypothetical protein
MKNLFKSIVAFLVFLPGYVYFIFTKKTLKYSYYSFRILFVATNGKLNNFFSALISKSNPYKINKEKSHSRLIKENISKIVSSINSNGYYEFEDKLDEQEVIKLFELAKNTPTRYTDLANQKVSLSKGKVLFNADNIISPRYQMDSVDLVQNELIQKIILDSSFREIAGKYLKSEPILDIVTMWWSLPFGNKGTSQAAQMYHFDMDRIKFLKFFIYLTDVHTDNGPHCYIKSSHKSIPSNIRNNSDRRIDDDELRRVYNPSDFKEFTGDEGTILAVDTRGFHKGKPLISDKRLLFQIQFSNSLFGAPYEKMPINNPSHEVSGILKNNSKNYKLLLS